MCVCGWVFGCVLVWVGVGVGGCGCGWVCGCVNDGSLGAVFMFYVWVTVVCIGTVCHATVALVTENALLVTRSTHDGYTLLCTDT